MSQNMYSSMKEQIKYRMIKNDYYDILDLSRKCSTDDIKRSYKKLALRFHPDKNTSDGAKEVFNKITNAYSKLSNSKTKAEYDETSRQKQKPASSESFNTFTQSSYYPFGNQSRFRNFNFQQEKKEQDPNNQKKFQQQRQQMEKQFEKVFRKFFEKAYPNERSQKPNQNYQKNQQKQYMERMKKQYQQQRRAKEKKERAQREQENKKNFAIFFIIVFLIIILGPYLLSAISQKPLYSFKRTNFYHLQRKTKMLQFSYFVNEKHFAQEGLNEKIIKVEQIVDAKMITSLKKQCITSNALKKSLEERAYRQKIGRGRNVLLQQAKAVGMEPCNILFNLATTHLNYLKVISR